MYAIVTQEQFGVATLSPLETTFINQCQTITVSATGTNLIAVDITTDVAGLVINAINSTATQVSFELTALNKAPIGPAIIRGLLCS